MMKLTLLFFFLICCDGLYGQYSLAGFVSANSSSLENVNVLLFRSADTMLLSSAISDANGAFAFDSVASGNYLLKIYHTGYKDTTISITANMLSARQTMHIVLETNKDVALKEVAVTYRKPLMERKADRLIFNVENSITNIGGDAMTALGKVPGVRVSGDNISITGKSSVRIMVNDRLLEIAGTDLVSYLKTIATDDIAAIEVITNPPAKYDAAGNSGLINIRLKKNRKQGWSVALRSTYTQATYAGLSAGAIVDYKKNKLTLHATINGNKASVAPFSEVDVYYPKQTWYQVDDRRDYTKYISGQVALDYQLSDKAIAGGSFYGSGGDPDIGERINTPVHNTANGVDSFLKTNAFTHRHTTYRSANGYYQYKFDSLGKKISVDVDHSEFTDTRNKYYSTQTFDPNDAPLANSYAQYRNNGSQDGKISTLKADLDLPYKNISFSCGGKLSFINNVSGYGFYNYANGIYVNDSSQSNTFNYTENVQALYANVDKTIKKWEIQAGLRGEMTEVKTLSPTLGLANETQYFKLFPTLFINYKPDDDNTFSLNYGKRINRPSYWELNPFRWFFNQYAYAEGNPYLQPSYNNNYELDYNFKDFFSASVYYSMETNRQDIILTVSDTSDIQRSIYANFLTVYSYGANFTYVFNKLKWVESNDQFQLFYNNSISNNPLTVHSLEGWGAYFSTFNSFYLNKNKTVSCEANFYYQFAEVDGVDNCKAFYNLNLGIKFLEFNKRLELSATVNDIFRSNAQMVISTVNNIQQVWNNYYDDRRLLLTVKYKFGNDRLKTTQHQVGNQEEAGRIK